MIPEKTLFLLRPDHLFICSQNDNSDKDKLCKSLNLFLEAILEKSHESALNTLNEAIKILEPVQVVRHKELISTNALLEPWEIEDFDNFFNIEHVETQERAACLVSSVLIAYKTWIELIVHSSSAITAQELETQKQGFKSCVRLLMRMFN